jgi:ABC-type transport system involved in multi-copper enzyme maturation permease subunit
MAVAVAAVADVSRPPLRRLVRVELRKMTDTRAGFWLLLITALLTALAAVLSCLTLTDGDRDLLTFLSIAVQPASILMPVVGILLVTSEWSQRTAMVTFALVPERSRVLVAKVLAGLALAGLAFALCVAVAVLSTALAGSGGGDTWSLSAGMLVQVAVSVAIPMLMGIAFGAVLLASAPAIVLSFVLPITWSILGSIAVLEDAARWLDTARTTTPLLEETLSATQWARIGTSLLLWLALPLAIGFWRVARSDVR